jgi:hypothetical protein
MYARTRASLEGLNDAASGAMVSRYLFAPRVNAAPAPYASGTIL